MKVLKSSLRQRNRYIVFSIACEKSLDRKKVVAGVWEHLLRFYGQVGVSKTSLWVMDWDPQTSYGIIKVNHGSQDLVASTLPLIANISGYKVAFRTVYVSGTLRKARQMLKKRIL